MKFVSVHTSLKIPQDSAHREHRIDLFFPLDFALDGSHSIHGVGTLS